MILELYMIWKLFWSLSIHNSMYIHFINPVEHTYFRKLTCSIYIHVMMQLNIFCTKYTSGIRRHYGITRDSGFFNKGSIYPFHWRHDGRDVASNHQPHYCLLSRLFRRRSKKTSKLRVAGLGARYSPGSGEFPAQITSNSENVSISWRHHVEVLFILKST